MEASNKKVEKAWKQLRSRLLDLDQSWSTDLMKRNKVQELI